MNLSRGGLQLIERAAALTGFAVAAITIIPRGVIGAGGIGGGDAHAYWLAGRNVLSGAPLYGLPSGTLDAYLYPPLFAQLISPFAAVLPAAGFIWGLRLLAIACLAVAAGGWTRAGIALLIFPPAIVELDTVNLHFELAAICTLALRGFPHLVPLGLALKLAGAGLVPYAFLRQRRGFLVGLAGVALVLVASIVLAPVAWADYLAFLATAQPTEYWTNLGRDIPLVARLAVAVALGLLAVRWVLLAPFAYVLSMPIVSLNSLSILVSILPAVRLPSQQPGTAPSPYAPALKRQEA